MEKKKINYKKIFFFVIDIWCFEDDGFNSYNIFVYNHDI